MGADYAVLVGTAKLDMLLEEMGNADCRPPGWIVGNVAIGLRRY
jgi:hypothetical protein